MALKATPTVLLVFAILAFAPETGAAEEPQPSERAAIEQIVASINSSRAENKPSAMQALLSRDLSAAERATILESEEMLCKGARQVFSEMTVPQLNIRALRVINQDFIEVDAVNAQFG